MWLGWALGGAGSRRTGEALLASVIAAARRSGFFGEGRAPDTLDGRFEMLSIHAALALLRVQKERAGRPLAQSFTDGLFRNLDAGLREAGTGDLSVPRKMKAIAQNFYGRCNAYGEALAAGDEAALAAALARNVWDAAEHPFAPPLAAYVAAAARRLAATPLARLADGAVWPDPPSAQA